ncbi:MAG: hypothetical protein LBF13_02175 [Campylobacteraceae bacterium]|jgi:hypothetical protein|nr:hypothetical protein [Campylobacteraceae bacterium]
MMELHDFLEEKEFVEIAHNALLKILSLLFRKEIPFSVLANIKRVSFNPPLPETITKRFQPATLFALEGYTLSSAKIEDGIFTFEAGFGESNIGSIVSMPIGAILHLSVDNTPLFLNMSVDTVPSKEPTKKAESKNDKSKRSLEAFLNNPENKNLFKK